MASLTYVCFIPAKELIRGLSANSSNIAFEVPLASKYVGGNLALYTFFLYKNVVFPAQAEYSYFSADFRLKIFLYYS